MADQMPPLPELIATWRKEYVRTKAEMQAVTDPLWDWLDENRSASARWFAEDVAALACDWDTYPDVLELLGKIDRHLHADTSGNVIPFYPPSPPPTMTSIKIENPDEIETWDE